MHSELKDDGIVSFLSRPAMVKNEAVASRKYSPVFINKQAKGTPLIENVEISIGFLLRNFQRRSHERQGTFGQGMFELAYRGVWGSSPDPLEHDFHHSF